MFEEADSDVLLLYDCCYSAATPTTGFFQRSIGVTEVIAACGHETIAPEVDQHSFSNSLVATLESLSQGPPFSVGKLHSGVMARLKCWTPDLARDRDGNLIPNPNKRLAYERQPRKTPVYTIIRESEPRRSIVLQPLQILPELRQETAVFGQSSSSAIPSSFNIVSQGNKGKPSNKRMRPEDDVKYPQIIISVRLDKAQVDIPAWLEFIRAFPPEGQDIKIDGIYDSFSTLLLIRIPVAVWDLLPAHPAYTFVGFVTSEIKIHEMEAEVQTRADSDTPISESGSATSMDRIPHLSKHDVEMPENSSISISQVESFSKPPQVYDRNIYPTPSIGSASVHGSQSPTPCL
jgi:hypothetical protein